MNKVWQKIGNDIFDTKMKSFRSKYNRKLSGSVDMKPVTSFKNGQRIQYLGHVLGREKNDLLKAVFEWKSQSKRLRGLLRKRWVNGFSKDLKHWT